MDRWFERQRTAAGRDWVRSFETKIGFVFWHPYPANTNSNASKAPGQHEHQQQRLESPQTTRTPTATPRKPPDNTSINSNASKAPGPLDHPRLAARFTRSLRSLVAVLTSPGADRAVRPLSFPPCRLSGSAHPCRVSRAAHPCRLNRWAHPCRLNRWAHPDTARNSHVLPSRFARSRLRRSLAHPAHARCSRARHGYRVGSRTAPAPPRRRRGRGAGGEPLAGPTTGFCSRAPTLGT